MKKLIIAAIALIGISASSFAQNAPAPKKNETAKTQTVKKSPSTKATDKQSTEKKTAMGGHKKHKAHKKHNS